MKRLIIILCVIVICFCGCDCEQDAVIQQNTTNSTVIEIPQETEFTGKTVYVKSIFSKKFHYEDCFWASRIYEENRAFYTDRQKLIDCGYIPCKDCKP